MEATQSLTESRQAGPVTAEELCRTYAASVCRFAAMVSMTTADAEDLAQDALLRAVRGLHAYDSTRGSMESWLWRIVANAARDAAGRRRRISETITRLGLFTFRESSSAEEIALGRIGDADLHRELRRLPLRDQTLIALRFGADLDMHQVGGAVGLSSDSAARALRRALARLRARLEEVQR
jgi:RNA polymerase sigma-70 factor (ECF subfamily)